MIQLLFNKLFPVLDQELNKADREQLVECIRCFIFKRYYKKSCQADRIELQHLSMNEEHLNKFRGVAYKFNKKRLAEFFSNPYLSFFFKHLKNNAEGIV